MKKLYYLLIIACFPIFCCSQVINNTGAKVTVPNGVYVVFSELKNSGAGASFYYNTNISISGNWTNIAPAIFDNGANGTVTFNGTTVQTITSGGSDFKVLTINNSSAANYAIILGDDMSISSQLNLTDGIINGNNHKVSFFDGASAGSGSLNSFIDGAVEKTGSTAFTYPVGNLNSRDLDTNSVNEDYIVWAPVEMTPSSSATVGVQYFFSNDAMPDWWEHGGNMDETLDHVSDREYWVFNSSVNLTNVTLYWKNNAHVGDICIHSLDDGDEANYDPADLSLSYYSDDGMWVDMGGTASSTHDEGSITSGPIPFSSKGSKYVTFGSKTDIDPLPIELLSFSSTCSDKGVELEWQSVSEINSYGYEIEKSLDAVNYNKIGFSPGAGNSNEVLNYNFTDQEVQRQVKYYRLKMVDFDGTYKYSNTVVAYCYENIEPIIMLYPNPFSDYIYIKGENMNANETTISVYDMLGQKIYISKTENTWGSFSEAIDLSQLSPAMYAIKIVSGNFAETVKVDKH